MTAIGTCLMFAERRINSEAAYRAFHAARLTRTGVKRNPQTTPLLAGLDCGIYLAWCVCGAGVGVDPRWGFAGCSCGRSWEQIQFPDAELLERLDAVLSLRPPGSIHRSPVRFYSWTPDQSVDDLVAENLRHGWPIPEARI